MTVPKVSRQATFAAVLSMLLVAAAPAAAAEDDELADAGERILIGQCSRCHATGKTGNSPLADAPPFRTLSAKYPLEHLAEALAEGITTGHADMPEFQFSTDEIAGILAHIERISEPTAPR